MSFAAKESQKVSAEAMTGERAAVTSALLEATSRLASQAEPFAVIQSMCESLLAATPRILLAWAWFGDPDTPEIRPMIKVGPAQAYADDLIISRNLLTERGPAFRALRSDTPDAASISRFSLFGPWRDANRQHGFQVAVAFPLRVPDTIERGLIVFYSDDVDYFDGVGLQPFEAFARLAEAALLQASLRERLQMRATHDSLTGLHNRDRLREELLATHVNAVRYGRPYAVLMFDLDHFKNVNDEFGHDVGDRAIEAVGRAAREAMRRGSMVGRWGGEEFLAILPEADVTAALAATERVRASINAISIAVPGADIGVRASYGIAVHDGVTGNVGELLIAVDKAMYLAKREGGDRIRVAPSSQ